MMSCPWPTNQDYIRKKFQTTPNFFLIKTCFYSHIVKCLKKINPLLYFTEVCYCTVAYCTRCECTVCCSNINWFRSRQQILRQDQTEKMITAASRCAVMQTLCHPHEELNLYRCFVEPMWRFFNIYYSWGVSCVSVIMHSPVVLNFYPELLQ